MTPTEAAVTSAMEPVESTPTEAAPVVATPAAGPPTAPATTPTDKPKKRHRGRTVGLVILALLLIAVAGAAFWAMSPTKPKPFDDTALATSEPNTLAYGALVSLGIDGPLVSVPDGQHIQALYDLRRSPADAAWLQGMGSSGQPMSPDDLQRAAIGALAAALPDALDIEVEQLDNLTHRTTWKVAMNDVVAFFDGDLTVEQFEARITKS